MRGSDSTVKCSMVSLQKRKHTSRILNPRSLDFICNSWIFICNSRFSLCSSSSSSCFSISSFLFGRAAKRAAVMPKLFNFLRRSKHILQKSVIIHTHTLSCKTHKVHLIIATRASRPCNILRQPLSQYFPKCLKGKMSRKNIQASY